MTPEDIGDIFQALEDALFAMAIRTMKHHQNWEQEEGFRWTQWQAEQIQGLRAYRQNVTALTDYYFTLAKQGIEAYLRQAYRNSVDDAAETARTIMMQTGRLAQFSQQFFGVNSKKLDVLINEAIQNIDTKRYAAINRMNTGYTDMLRKADIFAQSGSFTIPQAVDMAAKDFLSAGLNCVEYSNGNRVNIASYAEMALRTSSSEVTRQANGDVRDELGEYLVVSNVIGITCPICQKWQGKVLIDDVYASGKPDGKHKLVSQAKAAGFMHPNCRHQLYMYIPGLTEIANLPDTKITRERYKAEQQQRYQERQIRKYKRLRDGAMDPGNRQKYDARVKEWTQRHNEFLEDHDYLRKNPKRLAPGFTGNGKPEVKLGDSFTDKPIITITEESIQKVPKVNVLDDPELSSKIQETNKTILEMAMKENSNKEVAGVFTLDGKNIGFCKGVEMELTFSGDADRVLRMGRPSIALHNHPRGGKLSKKDMLMLLSTHNIQGLGCVSNAGGKVQIITKASNYDAKRAMIEFLRVVDHAKNPNDYSEMSRLVDKAIRKLISTGDIQQWPQ